MKKICHFCFAIFLVAGSIGQKANAHDIAVENGDGVTIYYNWINDNTELEVTYMGTSYNSNKYSGSVAIPAYVSYDGTDYNVTSIGYRAFKSCSALTSVTIPEGVTSIGSYAFSGCSGLTSVTIPSSMTSIGQNAFELCSRLTKVIVPDIAAWCGISFEYVKANPLYYAKHLFSDENTEITNLIIPEGVTSIGDYAFYYCSGLTSVTIPSSVTSIGNYAFSGCSGLTSVTIPEGVTSIGYWAFSGCEALTSVTIPEGVTSIGDYAFYYCSGLTSVTIPSSVTSIGNYAFSGCSGLTSVTIPEGVTSIGYWAFSGCEALTSVTIPLSVTRIGDYAFDGCISLTSVTIPSSVTIGLDAFPRGNKLEVNLYVTDLAALCNNKIVYRFTENNNNIHLYDLNGNEITELIIPSSVTSIGEYAFYNCRGLVSVNIPSSVTSIGHYAFRYCYNLTSVTIPSSMTSIGHYAFERCSRLTKVIVPDIAAWCGISFENNTANPLCYAKHLFSDENTEITNLIIPEGVTSIGNWAFRGCTGLTSMTFPSSVTSIGTDAFQNCTSLTSVKVPVTDLSAFCNNKLISLIKNNIGSPVYLIDYNGNEITEYVIPDGVTRIGAYAFYNCRGLVSVNIPSSVTSIGDSAFYRSGLTSVTIYSDAVMKKTYSRSNNLSTIFGIQVKEYIIGNDVTSIGDGAFGYYNSLESLTIGNGVLSIGNNLFDIYDPSKVIWLTNTPPSGYKNAEGKVNYVSNDLYTSLSKKTVYPFLSSMFEVDGVKYVPVSPSDRTCDAIDCIYNASYENIQLGETVANKGITFTINQVHPYAFYRNTFVKDLKLSLKGDVGKNAFYGCTSLQTVTLGKKVTSIGNESFSRCEQLKKIVIPDAVTSIGESAFSHCYAMTSATIGNGVKEIASYTFFDCSSLSDIKIGNKVTSINTSAFKGCSELPKIQIPQNVTEIGNDVFSNCSKLSTVILDDSNSELSLGSNGSNPIFYDCPLDSVYIGRKISYPTSSSSGYSPFYRNNTLRSVTIGDNETDVSPNEFYGCTNLKNVIIGNGVTKFGNWAFSGCSSLDYFSFGTGVKTIGKETFSDCTAMTRIISHASVPPTCDSQALDDINKWNCTLSVPQGSLSAYQQANQWKEFFFINDDVVSGIRGATNDASVPETIYDVNGHQLNDMQPGINIIRYSDGSTKKVVVK